jgi:hypothetical protein
MSNFHLHFKRSKPSWKSKYQEYLLQWEKPKKRFYNRYNILYDFNFWDRHWMKKLRRRLKNLRH